MLACNQNGMVGKLVHRDNGVDIWRSPHRTNASAGWFGVFNRNEMPWQGRVNLSSIGVPDGSSLHNVWDEAPLMLHDGLLDVSLDPDDVRFVHYSPEI